MFPFESNEPQLQSWPTPEMFIRVGIAPRMVFEFSNNTVTLDSVFSLIPFTETISESATVQNVTMDSVVSILPFTETISESATVQNVTLDSVVSILPLSRTISDAAENNNVTLDSVSV